MKTLTFLLMMMCVVLLFLQSGCKEDEGTDPRGPTLTDDDIADMIAGSIAGVNATNGLSVQASEAATLAGGGHLDAEAKSIPIGFLPAAVDTVDTTIVRQKFIGSYSYDYSFHYTYNFLSPDSFQFYFVMKGVYNTPRISGADTASATMIISKILPPDTVYLLNATYTRYGTQTSKLRDKNSFYSFVGFLLTDIKVSKATNKIKSGSVSVYITIDTSDGNELEYSGTLTFYGNQLAQLALNGKSYTIDLATGNIL